MLRSNRAEIRSRKKLTSPTLIREDSMRRPAALCQLKSPFSSLVWVLGDSDQRLDRGSARVARGFPCPGPPLPLPPSRPPAEAGQPTTAEQENWHKEMLGDSAADQRLLHGNLSGTAVAPGALQSRRPRPNPTSRGVGGITRLEQVWRERHRLRHGRQGAARSLRPTAGSTPPP